MLTRPLSAAFILWFATLCCSLLAFDVRAEDSPVAEPIEIVSWKETLARVAAHPRKIVVLDVWSTSCEPCVEEFPKLVELHRQYAKAGVVCMSLNCDYVGIASKPAESYRPRVQKFLRQQGADFENYVCSAPADELFQQMDLPSIPAVYVFGRDGKLVKRFENSEIKSDDEAFTYADVVGVVKKLLEAE